MTEIQTPTPVILVGPPGTGKTMWARKTTQWIGPPAVLEPHTWAAHEQGRLLRTRQTLEGAPFRAPHHTCSMSALMGRLIDSYRWQPGECSLAHGGTLFLDEGTEFRQPVWEVIKAAYLCGYLDLHGPASTGAKIRVPALYRLVISMTPCPCGYLDDKRRECKCTPEMISRHVRRIPAWLYEHARKVSPEEYGGSR